jgi:hypothetical protein
MHEDELHIVRSLMTTGLGTLAALEEISCIDVGTYEEGVEAVIAVNNAKAMFGEDPLPLTAGLEEAKKESKTMATKLLLALDAKLHKYANVFKTKFEEFNRTHTLFAKAFKSRKGTLSALTSKEIKTTDILKHKKVGVLGFLGVFDGKNTFDNIMKVLDDYEKLTILDRIADALELMPTDKDQKQVYDTDNVKELLKIARDKDSILCKVNDKKRVVVGFLGNKFYVLQKCKVLRVNAKAIPYRYSITPHDVPDTDDFGIGKTIVLPSGDELETLMKKTLDVIAKRKEFETRLNNTIMTDNKDTNRIIKNGSWEDINIYTMYVECLYLQLKMHIELPSIVLALVDIATDNRR